MTPPTSGAATLRVLALDVDRMRRSRAGLLRVIREVAPDIALLHRVPVHPLSRHRIGALASDTGLLVCLDGRASGGAAVLTSLRAEPTDTEVFAGPGGGMALAHLRLTGGQRLRVATVDTHGDDADEAAVVAHLVALLGTPDGTPTVVAGDLPGSAGGDALRRRFADLTPGAGPTTPADVPVSRPRGLLGVDADVRPLALPGAPGAQPELLAKVTPSRPTLVELVLA